jgi:hypothetical protein
VRVQRVLLAIVAATAGWGCALTAEGSKPAASILLSHSSSFTLVTAGEVHGAVPEDWVVSPVDTASSMRSGFVASPRADGWPTVNGTAVGMSATWVDATRVGVPSDYYYLAANGPLLSRLTTSANCRERSERIYLDRRPTLDPDRWSPGHFMASGDGICRRGGQETRYAYFVAAPGFGRVHQLGIPRSGLYVVVAVVPHQDGSRTLIKHLIRQTRFGDAGIKDFVEVACDVRRELSEGCGPRTAA